VPCGEGSSTHLHLLLVSGSTRRPSSNSAALHTAVGLLPDGVSAKLYEGLAALPAFNPDDDHDPLPPEVARLREEIARADGVLLCTPEYAGTLPGSLKNLLDWTVGGGEMYGMPVAWINVAAPGRGTGADAALGTVLSYVGAAVAPSAGVRVSVAHDVVRNDGLISDPELRRRLSDALATIVAEMRASRAS
jgi:chromate reductase